MFNHRLHYLLEIVHHAHPLLRHASRHEINALVGLITPDPTPGYYRLTEMGQQRLAFGRSAIERATLELLVQP
jgi:hypothetical protein